MYTLSEYPGSIKLFAMQMNILDFIINALPGGILRIAGIAMTPRIILMTDGQPTDSAGEEEVCKSSNQV